MFFSVEAYLKVRVRKRRLKKVKETWEEVKEVKTEGLDALLLKTPHLSRKR